MIRASENLTKSSKSKKQLLLKSSFIVYLISVLFLFPYGFVVGANNIRLSDFFSLLLFMAAMLEIVKRPCIIKPKINLFFVFLLTFIGLELTLPILAVLNFGGLALISSSFRTF